MGLVSVGNRGVGNLRLIGLVGLGPASRVFTFHLLGRTPVSLEALLLRDCPRTAKGQQGGIVGLVYQSAFIPQC
jgi:hypothetical protein